MCGVAECPVCGGWRLTGCGRHPWMLQRVPEHERCPGHDPAPEAEHP